MWYARRNLQKWGWAACYCVEMPKVVGLALIDEHNCMFAIAVRIIYRAQRHRLCIEPVINSINDRLINYIKFFFDYIFPSTEASIINLLWIKKLYLTIEWRAI